MECDLWVGTSNYGGLSLDEPDPYTYNDNIENLSELYLHAINRDIDISLEPEEICQRIKDEMPSKEWQLRNLIDISNRKLISEEEFKKITSYSSYSFETMNDSLRKGWTTVAPINDYISRMQSIDKDIVVFRYLIRFKFLPTAPGSILNSKGYLSTTMDPLLASNAVCNEIIKFNPKNGAIVKIKVPAGKKAIYLPGREKELLFPHDIQLSLISYRKGKFVCPTKDRKTCHILDNVPIFEFLML